MTLPRPKLLPATVLLALALTGIAVAAGNPGAPGSLRFSDCTANAGAGGCKTPAQDSLTGADAIAVSPGGKSVYVASYGSDSISQFARGPNGHLTFRRCHADNGLGGCENPPIDSLKGPGGVAVSPGGGDVYVTGGLAKAVTRFRRGAGGNLTFATCTASGGIHGCTDPTHDSLVGATGIAISRGGGNLYVTSYDGAAVSHLVRKPNGTLDVADCVAPAGIYGCHKLNKNPFAGAAGIALSPDGRNAYVASAVSNSLSVFSITKTGALVFKGCIAEGAANFCAKLKHGTLTGAAGVAVGPNGRSVYVTAQKGVLIRFRRSPKLGKLTFSGCIADEVTKGCTKTRHGSLEQATGVAVAPNGRDIYVASSVGDSITRFAPTAGGRIAQRGCIATAGANGCGHVARGAALDGAYALAFGPGARQLYATASVGQGVSGFSVRQR